MGPNPPPFSQYYTITLSETMDYESVNISCPTDDIVCNVLISKSSKGKTDSEIHIKYAST
jgi:hypothetical protein